MRSAPVLACRGGSGTIVMCAQQLAVHEECDWMKVMGTGAHPSQPFCILDLFHLLLSDVSFPLSSSHFSFSACKQANV
jgi:hypothetical protein